MISINIVLDNDSDFITIGGKLVATLQDFLTKLDSIDGKVTAIATEIADLKAQLAAGGLSAADEQKVVDRLDTLTAALDAAK